MSQTGGYRSTKSENDSDSQMGEHENGDGDEKKRIPLPMVSIYGPKKFNVRVRIPVKEHPRYNFVGKLLGPSGNTLKELKRITGCTMAIMGRGSMKNKEKEEELRDEGGKYAHLNEPLHVFVECHADPADAYSRLSSAISELRNYLDPSIGYGSEPNDEIAPPPSYRGRGGRGSFRGRGGPPLLSTRGAIPSSRGGGPPSRGGPLGGRGGPRSAPRSAPYSRGAPPSKRARSSPSSGYGGGYGGRSHHYEEYDDGDYGSGGHEYGATYDDGYEGGYENY